MQAIVMAAGMGTRLGDLASDRPKAFVEIKGKSLIDINVHMLKEHGIDNIIIVTGHHSDMFERKFQNVSGIDLVFNPFYSFTNVIGSFYMGMGSLHDDFIYMHADTLCEPSILDELLASDADIVLPIDTKPCDDEAMKVKTIDGRVCGISKKMDSADCDGEFIGVAKIKSGVLPDLRRNAKQLLQNEEYSEYFEAVLQKTVLESTFRTQLLKTGTRFWAEIDFREDYERAVKNIPWSLYRF